MSNNFIFPHQADPLLTDDTLNQLELYKQQLLAERSRVQQAQPKSTTKDNPWDDTEKELGALTEEQKATLMADPAFVEANTEVQSYLSELLNSLLKPEMIKSETGQKLLKDRLDVVRTLKKKVIKETSKQMELFKEYTEGFSDISWGDFLKLKAL